MKRSKGTGTPSRDGSHMYDSQMLERSGSVQLTRKRSVSENAYGKEETKCATYQ